MHDDPLLSCYNLMVAMAIIDEEPMEARYLGSVSLFPVFNCLNSFRRFDTSLLQRLSFVASVQTPK